MTEREPIVATALVLIILVALGGGVFHVSPDFAGSPLGGALGVSGALLMLWPLVYMVVKRVRSIKAAMTRYVSMGTLLSWHVYAGLLGSLLVLLHTGHKFESVLGTSLTALTLIVVFTGFPVRYLLRQVSDDLRGKRSLLSRLYEAFDAPGAMDDGSPVVIARLVGAIADVESAIQARETLKRWFSRWLRFHIFIAMSLYLLLALHIWAAIYFGLRWF